MKHDPYFKYLAAVIIVGVVVALVDPTPLPATPADVPALVMRPADAAVPLPVAADKTITLKKPHRNGRPDRAPRAPRQS